jgi:GNAT superfamily N-acetyltransferase
MECAICIAIDPEGQVIGGVRLQRHLPERPMPSAGALRTVDGFEELLAHDLAQGGCGECCGLWVSADYAGFGLGDILMIAALSQTRRWTGASLWGISPRRMIPRYLNAGYQTCTELGDRGAFWYAPVADDAWILRVPTARLESSTRPTAALSAQLRETGRGRGATEGPRGSLKIFYDLDIPELACAL